MPHNDSALQEASESQTDLDALRAAEDASVQSLVTALTREVAIVKSECLSSEHKQQVWAHLFCLLFVGFLLSWVSHCFYVGAAQPKRSGIQTDCAK